VLPPSNILLANKHFSSLAGFFCPENGDDTFLRNVCVNKTHTAPHLRRRHSSTQFSFKQTLFNNGCTWWSTGLSAYIWLSIHRREDCFEPILQRTLKHLSHIQHFSTVSRTVSDKINQFVLLLLLTLFPAWKQFSLYVHRSPTASVV
jgi:hypothetical protein